MNLEAYFLFVSITNWRNDTRHHIIPIARVQIVPSNF